MLGIQFQRLLQMPCNGLSLAVFIICQPHRVGLFHRFLQVGHQLVLLLGNLVLRLILVLYVYTHLLLGKIADMSVARLDYIVLAKEFLNGL